jgi:hypothetical protein
MGLKLKQDCLLLHAFLARYSWDPSGSKVDQPYLGNSSSPNISGKHLEHGASLQIELIHHYNISLSVRRSERSLEYLARTTMSARVLFMLTSTVCVCSLVETLMCSANLACSWRNAQDP